MDYKRETQKFVSTGIELNTPVNLIPPGKYPFLKNVRSYQGGRMGSRQGLTKVNPAPIADLNIHSLARMNDYISVDFIRFVGANNNLYAGNSTFAVVDSGYSGNPMSIIPYRPDQSVRDWAYIMDSNKSQKIAADLTKYRVGIAPPTAVPAIELRVPSFNFCDAVERTNWVPQLYSTTGAMPSSITNEELLQGCTVGVEQDDSPSTGWSSIVPGAGGRFWDIGTHDVVKIGGQPIIVSDLCHCPAPTNLGSVATEITDASGQAMVTPGANIKGLRRNTLLQLGGSYTRALAIALDKKQVNSFRVANPFGGAGTGITVPTHSFRAGTTGLGGAINKYAIGATFNGPCDAAIISLLGAPGWNLGTTFDGRTIGPNDYITFSVYVTDLTRITAVRVLFDIDPGTASLGAVGTRNALYKDFTPEDFNGNYAWKTFRLRIADLTRVGGDTGCDLTQIPAVQLRVITPADSQPTDTVVVKLAGIYTSGTYGPDTATNLTPYLFRYRYRSSATGARSLPGPAMESGIFAQREAIRLNMIASADPQVDKIDIERFGGTNTDWHYIGTCDNSSPTFLDGSSDQEIITSAPLEIDRYATFPIVDVPYSATVDVAGSAVKFVAGAGGGFNPNWSVGTEIIVNGVRTIMVSAPDGGTGTFLVEDSLGGLQSVELDIAAPVKAGQPLPRMWGPFFECLFGVGNQLSPGTLYFTNPSDPDSSAVINNIDITTPTESLLNGCLFDGRNYVWSDKRMFSVLHINNPNTPEFLFQYTEVPNHRGLWAPFAFAVGPKIWYLGPDGIYETVGGEPVLITKDIQPIFPQGERPGFAVRGIQPVKMAQAGVSVQLKLTYHNGFLYFDYTDTNGNPATMVYDTTEKAWYPDSYFQGAGGITSRFSEYGSVAANEVETLLCGSGGTVYFAGGLGDDTFQIDCQIDTPSKDFGDPRAKKIYSEIVFELNTNGVAVTSTPYLDNYATALTAKIFNNVVQQILVPQDLAGNGVGVFSKNLGTRITWSSRIASPDLYSWEPSYLERPEDTFFRADDWSDAGYGGSKFITGFLVEADTEGVDKVVTFEGDQGFVQTYTMNHPGQTIKVYSVKPQTIKTLVRLHPQTEVAWREFRVSYIFEKYPELSDLVTPYTDGGWQGAKLMRGVDIEALGGPAVTEVETDGGVQKYSLTLDHTTITALHTKPYAFRPPFIATELRLNPATAIRLGRIKWIYDQYPDFSPLITSYTDGGYDGAKFVQGFKLEAAGGPVTLFTDYDGDQQWEGLSVNHTDSDGVGVLLTKGYSFQNPVIAHELRLRTSGNTDNVRLGRITWVYEPAPELVEHWVSQGTSHGIPGWQFLKDAYIAHQSTADITLTIIMEGIGEVFQFNIPNSGGQYKKSYILLGTGLTRTLKDKLFRYRLDTTVPGTGFRLFKRDCEIRVHPWSEITSPINPGGYQIKRPFGDVPMEDGAKI